MPKYQPLAIASPSKTYAVTGITGASAGWQDGNDSFENVEAFSVTRRPVTNGQQTRKSTVRLTKPLVDVCPTTCVKTSRGSILGTLDFTSSVQSKLAEREDAYDSLVALLNDTDVRNAVVNNEAFWG